MTRLSLFSSPLLLGFDQFERALDRVTKTSEGYPPYNIEQIGEQGIRITLAVAGFSRENLCITVEDNQLTIRGKHTEDEEKHTYLHRGIANRQFQRTFVLAEGIEVKSAEFHNGLLHIDLLRPLPERRVRSININEISSKERPGQQIERALAILNSPEKGSAEEEK